MTTLEPTSLLDAVQAVAPVVREYADLSEREGKIADAVVAAMKREGLFRGLAPRSLGGTETDPVGWFKAVEAAARVDGSFGWCVMINGSTGLIGRLLAGEEAERLLTDPDTIVSGSVFPFGKATATQGGFIGSGHWTYASGIPFASHVFGFAMIHDGDVPRMAMPGVPALVALLTPVASVEVLNTWDVNGLCATGSHDFVMDDVFVPQEYALGLTGNPSNQHYTSAVYRLPFMTLFALPIAAVGLGIAQHAIDSALELAVAKVPAGGTVRMGERPLFHTQLAEAQAAVNSARAWLHAQVAEQYALVQAGKPVELPMRNQTHLAASNATRSAARAVELMYLAGGGSANFRKSPLQRCLRDIHAVTQHVGTGPGTWETAGAVIAGLPPANPFMLL